jgi:hypothetical protein
VTVDLSILFASQPQKVHTVPETYWLAVHTARMASAAALAQMVAEGEISEAKALHIARDYFHDTTAKLFGLPTLGQSGK